MQSHLDRRGNLPGVILRDVMVRRLQLRSAAHGDEYAVHTHDFCATAVHACTPKPISAPSLRTTSTSSASPLSIQLSTPTSSTPLLPTPTSYGRATRHRVHALPCYFFFVA